jgi:uncharacterized metal-binding protein YceD (DUF177 family)
VGTKNEFVIPFVGLNPGEHHYDFTIGNAFFEDLEYSEIREGHIDVKLKLTKQSTMLILNFGLTGQVHAVCDRCGDDFDMPVAADHQLIVKLGTEHFEDNDEMISIPSGEYEFDVKHYIYEYLILSLPARRMHADAEDGGSGCDPEVLKKLDEISTKEEPAAGDEIDPRWAALKNLKKK